MLRGIVTIGGYEVVGEADNGRDAVDTYLARRPDVVVMDMVMPVMGGLDAVREIIRHDPAARIVMCSAMSQRELVDEALAAGAQAFVNKPFSTVQVLEALRAVAPAQP
jgi:two-component system chemotaxis response regulator CheY